MLQLHFITNLCCLAIERLLTTMPANSYQMHVQDHLNFPTTQRINKFSMIIKSYEVLICVWMLKSIIMKSDIKMKMEN